MIIDTHVHLDDDRYIDDVEDVLKRAQSANVTAHIIPGADPKHLERAIELCNKHENIYFSIGVHPYDAQNYDEEYLLKFATHKKCIAVGECGLDYFRLPDDETEKRDVIEKQKEVFISQIELAKRLKKPLIIHIRDASSDSKEILLKYGAGEVGGVLHCFNADEQLLSLAEENFYFGIGGVLTFKNARKLVQVLPHIPKDKLLIETDAPYLTPHPHRGERNEPAYTTFVAKKISDLLEIPLEKVENITTSNAKELFRELKEVL